MKTRHYLILFLSLLWNAVPSFAGNLKIQNVSATANDVTFDISWDNSWRSDAAGDNWDAVWVFVKVQDCQSLIPVWVHQNLANSAVHTAGAGLQVDHVTDGKGVFIRRSTEGAGNIASTSITLAFAAAVTLPLNFDVIGIEMAYVPQGSFVVGTTHIAYITSPYSSGSNVVYGGSFGTGLAANNYEGTQVIGSEAAIAADGLRSFAMVHNAIPAGFPKGFSGFYCMKYEMTQGQYCHFLNKLSIAQQAQRVRNSPLPNTNTYAFGTSPFTAMSNRNAIKVKTMGNSNVPIEFGMDLNNNNVFDEAADGGSIAMNFLTLADLMAYLDWAALRPMTELEYEKAARGSFGDPSDIWPWGFNGTYTPTPTGAATILNPGTEQEILSDSTCALLGIAVGGWRSGISGPLRVGFAGRADAKRERAGTSPYGIFDLIGNVTEQTIQIPSTAYPTAFNGTLGDGNVDVSGNANAATWLANTVAGLRGANFYTGIYPSNDILYLGTSIGARSQDGVGGYPNFYVNVSYPQFNGGRGVRQY